MAPTHHWTKIWAREYSVQYSEIAILSCLKPVERILGGSLKAVAMVPQGNGVQACYADDATGWNSLIQRIADTHLKDADAFSFFCKQFDVLGERYIASSEKLSHAAKTASLKDLIPFYNSYFSNWLFYSAALWAAYLLNEHATFGADAFLAKRFGAKKGAEYSHKILSPSQPTEISLAMRLLSELKNNHGAAQSFLDAYPWFSCLDVHNRPWSLNEAQKAIRSARPPEKIEPTNIRTLLDLLNPSPSERFLLESAHTLCFMKDQRDVYRRKGVHASLAFYAFVGKNANQRGSDVAYWTYSEIISFLTGGPHVPLSVVKKRKNGFLLYGDSTKMTIVQGVDVPEHLNVLDIHLKPVAIPGVVKGVSASAGIATGTVKIVRTVSDLDKVQKNDVMVAVTTHPDFVSAMHRACAIVTDEGGLTSHAAIVSREFRIPCVVGTKNATFAFNDGDFIEVNASQGTVKKVTQ